jgi:TetR/AcrR family transcriptional regulator
MINQGVNDAGRRAQILDAARDVIAERGFRGASIKRIAERAGIRSPALIYWYFKDKQALLDGLFERMSPFLHAIAHAEASLDAEPEEVLTRIATSFMAAAQQPDTGHVLRIMLAEFARHQAVANFFAERGPLVVVRFLERYLARQAERGRLAEHDPRAAARAFMGMLVVYVLGREIFPGVASGFPDAQAYAEQVTRIFLHGLASEHD